MAVDVTNAFAANGIGCVLALRNQIQEAKDIFIKVGGLHTAHTHSTHTHTHTVLPLSLYANVLLLCLSSQVRESASNSADSVDSWLNLAHCYVEQASPLSRIGIAT